MMKKLRPKKYSILYYVGVFLTVSITLAIYGIFDYRRSEVSYLDWLFERVYFPFFITIIMLVFHRFRKRIEVSTSEEKKKHDFVLAMSEKVKEELDYTLEDFKKLQENIQFQQSLYDAYNIYYYGESEMLNKAMIESRFKEDSLESKAMSVILEEIDNM